MAKPGLRTCTCSKDKRHLSFAFSQENLFPRAQRSRILKHGHGQGPAHGQTPFPATSLLGSESKPSFCGNTKRCCSLTPSHCQTAASHPPELLRKTHCPKKWLNPFSFFFFLLGMQTEHPFGTDRNPAARQTQPNPDRNARKRSKFQARGYKLKARGRNTNYLQGRSCCSSHQEDKELLITLPAPPVPGNIK